MEESTKTKFVYSINYKEFNKVMGNPKISLGAKLTLYWMIQLGGKGGRIYPSQETIGKKLGKKPRQVRYYISELFNLEIIENYWKERYPGTNHYEISEAIYCPTVITGGSSVRQPIAEWFGKNLPDEYGNELPISNIEVSNIEESNTVSYQRQGVDKSTPPPQKENKGNSERRNG